MPNEWDEPPPDDEEDGEIAPGDPDYDLSEAHGYTWEPERRWSFPPWLVAVISLILATALVLPTVLFILNHS
jgi:hypothetical protein